MMEKPKKERKFLKILGKVGEILLQELLIKVGKSLVQKIGGKKTLPSIIFLSLFYNIAFASIDSIPYPITGNKQRLGWQTTGNGLIFRGTSADTVTKPSNYTNKDIKAYFLLDTVNNVLYNYIASKGGWKFNNSDTVIIQGVTMPFDSITFNTAKDGTVGVGEVEYNDTQGSLIQGLKGGNVTNVIGQQLHQRVNNKTGGTLAKGTVVYLSGSQGNRITVAKALATSDPTSANTFGIVAEEILDNESGYVITEGLITNINTSALTQDSAVYLSGTTAGALTSTKPQAPIHGVYIGVCVKSNAGSGELFVKIRNGQELDELHDVQITSPVDKASLYYKSSEGLWRDTTAALLVSDTATMLSNYLLSGTASSTYLTQSYASSTYTPLTRSISTTSPLQGGGDLSANKTFSILSASESQSGILTTTAQNIGGSKAFKANIVADSFIYLNNTSPVPTTLLGLNTSGNVNNVGKFSLGAGLSITSGSLLTDTNYVVTRFDTASMLTNYLRTGTAASTYISGSGTTNYLPKFTNTNILGNSIIREESGLIGINKSPHQELSVNGYIAAERIAASLTDLNDGNTPFAFTTDYSSSFLGQGIIGDRGGLTGIKFYDSGAGQLNIFNKQGNIYGDIIFSTGSTPTERIRLTSSGHSIFQYGVSFNEGSFDSDTRIESDGNANMIFVDASTDRVGIGTSSPSKTLDVNGELKISTTTATPTSLLGKDGSNVVGELTDINQSGVMKVGSTTATTNTVGGINVAHGLSYTPTKVIATIAQMNSYVIVIRGITSTNLEFTIYDSVTGNALNSVSVGFFWLAIK